MITFTAKISVSKDDPKISTINEIMEMVMDIDEDCEWIKNEDKRSVTYEFARRVEADDETN